MARQKKLRFISGLILAVLLLWYSAILFWPMKQKQNSDRKIQEEENDENKEKAGEQTYEYPWELCQPMRYFSESESHPLTALASFPGSGNTWVRYLLQQSTGIHTGFAHLERIDKALLEHGFPGEAVADARVVVIKTHRLLRNNHIDFQRAVLIIREPGAAILANYNHQYSKGNNHTGVADWNTFYIYWKRYFNKELPRWRDTNLDWLQNFKGPLHVLMYEDLVNNLEVTLRGLIKFLELPVNEAALQCTLQRPEGVFHRKKRKYTFDLFNSEMLNKIKIVEDVVYKELKRRRG